MILREQNKCEEEEKLVGAEPPIFFQVQPQKV